MNTTYGSCPRLCDRGNGLSRTSERLCPSWISWTSGDSLVAVPSSDTVRDIENQLMMQLRNRSEWFAMNGGFEGALFSQAALGRRGGYTAQITLRTHARYGLKTEPT